MKRKTTLLMGLAGTAALLVAAIIRQAPAWSIAALSTCATITAAGLVMVVRRG